MKIKHIELEPGETIEVSFKGWLPTNNLTVNHEGTEATVKQRSDTVFVYKSQPDSEAERTVIYTVSSGQATRVAEPQWTPGMAEQAVSRADRKPTEPPKDEPDYFEKLSMMHRFMRWYVGRKS